MTPEQKAALRAQIRLAFPPTSFEIELNEGKGKAHWYDWDGQSFADEEEDEDLESAQQEVINEAIVEIIEERIGREIEKDYEFSDTGNGHCHLDFSVRPRDE